MVGIITKSMEEAQRYLEEAQVVFKATGNRRGTILTLNNMGMIASSLKQATESKRLYQEALALAMEIGDRRSSVGLLDNLGSVAYELGENAQAAHDFAESLKLALEIGTIPPALLAVAAALAKQRRSKPAKKKRVR